MLSTGTSVAHIQELSRVCRDVEVEISDTRKGSGRRRKLIKVMLAYSGGLDTSVLVPWLKENYGCDVVCFITDVSQGAGAIYKMNFLLGTSMARPIIAKAMVDVAKEVRPDVVSHRCTRKGNARVWFELTFFDLNSKLNVMALWREWNITGRENATEYAKMHNVPIPGTKKSIYSSDRNLWHLNHEGNILQDHANESTKDLYMMYVDPEDAPDQVEYVGIGIESGILVSVNEKRLLIAFCLLSYMLVLQYGVM